jgi:hypothetical protein
VYNFEHVNVKLCIVISPLIKDDKCKCNCIIKNTYTYIFTHHIKQNTQMHNHITQWHMHYFILFFIFQNNNYGNGVGWTKKRKKKWERGKGQMVGMKKQMFQLMIKDALKIIINALKIE